MARVTVEDCIANIPNRFELILAATHRARTIAAGAQITVPRDNDKNPVVALREIGENRLSPGDLMESLIHSMQKNVEIDEPDSETAPPLVAPDPETGKGDDPQFERMTEEDLLRGLDELTPPPERDEEGE